MRPPRSPAAAARTLLLRGLLGACAAASPRTALAQTAARDSAPRADTATLTVAQLRADFDALRRALGEAHGGFDRFAPRADVERRLEVHRARLARPMTRPELAGVLAEAIAELRDGHARLELDSTTAGRLAAARVLPLRVMFDGDRLMVLSNDAPADSTIRPGMEIERIDGRPVREVVGLLLPKIAGDGFIESGRRRQLARDLPQLLWLHGDQGSSYRVDARDPAGRMVSAVLPGILERERRGDANPVNAAAAPALARLAGPRAAVTLTFPPDSATARLRVAWFDGEDFPARLDTAFRTLRERGTRALVLDLRGNGGGVDEYGALLLSHLTDRPFRYFDHIRVTSIAPSFATWLPRTFESLRTGTTPAPAGDGFLVTTALHPGVGVQQPAPRPFLGRLVVLIDGGSFSTTADVAAHLRSWRRATFVGEETGGGYEGNTSGLNALVVLPHSRLRHKVMMYGYWNAVRPPARRGRGTLPDHVVAPRVADVLRGDDPVLARAIALLRE